MIRTKYKTREEKIGEIVLNKQGTPMKLIEYRDSFDCDVEFQDKYKYIAKHVVYHNFQKGQVKNPYGVTVFGMGMLGDGRYMARYPQGGITKEYRCWANMIERCYQNKELHPSYHQIATVCDEWLNYQNFAKWHEENFYFIPSNERLQLDKDILFPGNKIYSPDTCLLVPQRVNLLFTNMTKNDGLPNGIRRTLNGNRFQAAYNTESLGTYDTLEKAYQAYSMAKEKAIKQIADEYKKYIPKILYDTLYKYEVKIENDKNYIRKCKK